MQFASVPESFPCSGLPQGPPAPAPPSTSSCLPSRGRWASTASENQPRTPTHDSPASRAASQDSGLGGTLTCGKWPQQPPWPLETFCKVHPRHLEGPCEQTASEPFGPLSRQPSGPRGSRRIPPSTPRPGTSEQEHLTWISARTAPPKPCGKPVSEPSTHPGHRASLGQQPRTQDKRKQVGTAIPQEGSDPEQLKSPNPTLRPPGATTLPNPRQGL